MTIYIFIDINGNEFDRTSDPAQAQRLTAYYRTLCGGGEWVEAWDDQAQAPVSFGEWLETV